MGVSVRIKGKYEGFTAAHPPGPGVYSTDTDPLTKREQPQVVPATPCPYCHDPLSGFRSTKISRIVLLLGKTPEGIPHGLQDQIPDTHLVLTCRPCNQIFTLPKVAEYI